MQFTVFSPALVVLFTAWLGSGADAFAQSVIFYQGKTIRVVAGTSSGGGYDRWARMIARQMPKYIPGVPEIIVQNMPGAGGRIAANHIYGVAKGDGLTLGMISRYAAMDQLIGAKEVAYDVRRLHWIGSPETAYPILVMRADTPYKTIDDIIKAKEPPKCADTSTSSSGYQLAKLLEETLGARFQMIMGYPGGPEMDLSVEKGETVCRGVPISTHFTREPGVTWHKTNFDRHIVQTGRKRDARAADTPTIHELMDQYKAPEASRRVAMIILSGPEFGFPMVAPPGTPPDQVNILREVYARTLQDPEVLAQAQKARLNIDPSSGEELQALAKEVVDQPPAIVERLKKLLAH